MQRNTSTSCEQRDLVMPLLSPHPVFFCFVQVGDWCTATSSPEAAAQLKTTVLTTRKETFILATAPERNCFSAWTTQQNLAPSLHCTAPRVQFVIPPGKGHHESNSRATQMISLELHILQPGLVQVEPSFGCGSEVSAMLALLSIGALIKIGTWNSAC